MKCPFVAVCPATKGVIGGATFVALLGLSHLALAQEMAPVAGEVVGEAPVVAGNLAAAKEKAMNEAFRQMVEGTFTALLEELGVPGAGAVSPALAALRAGWQQKPRRLVRRHQVLEQGEANGYYRVRLTAELDQVYMRREMERVRGPAVRAVAAGALPLVASGALEAGTALTVALTAAGIAVDVQKNTPAEAGKLRELAGRSGTGAALLVSGQAAVEGPVRGTDQVSVECHIGVRVIFAPPRDPSPERGASGRGFHARASDARASCFATAAAEALGAVVSDLRAASGTGGTRVVTLDLDLNEPAAVSAVLRALQRVGGAHAAEVRRVMVGRVSVQVASGLAPEALAGALARELAPVATVGRGPTQGDRIELQIRLLSPAGSPGGDGISAPGAALPGASPLPGASSQGVP
jgi:hypothetical protein